MIFEGGKHHEKETLVCTDFPVPSFLHVPDFIRVCRQGFIIY
jgi:hypothetical protein